MCMAHKCTIHTRGSIINSQCKTKHMYVLYVRMYVRAAYVCVYIYICLLFIVNFAAPCMLLHCSLMSLISFGSCRSRRLQEWLTRCEPHSINKSCLVYFGSRLNVIELERFAACWRRYLPWSRQQKLALLAVALGEHEWNVFWASP